MALSTPARKDIVSNAFVPQAVDNTTVTGATVSAPSDFGRFLQFIFCWVAALASGQTLVFTFQGQRDDTDAWETIQDKDGNDLEITVDENETDTFLKATLPIYRLGERPTSSEVGYKAYRVQVTENGVASILVAGIASIMDLYEHPGQADAVADLLHPRN